MSASRASHAVAHSAIPDTAARSRLYLGAAVLFAVVVTIGFTPTYWAPMFSGTLTAHPVIHVHATLFFTWLGFLILQSALVRAGRRAWHREVGLFGIGLASMMLFSGLLAAIVSLQAGLRGPRPDVVRATVALSLSGILMFGAFVATAIAYRRRPDWHGRLMLLAGLELMQPGIGRLTRLLPGVTFPAPIVIATVLVDLVLVAIVLIDRRSVGRIHPAWLTGGSALLVVHYARLLIGRTETWTAFTNWLAALGS